MILQALCELYEDLVRSNVPDVARDGWDGVGVGQEILVRPDGSFEGVSGLRVAQEKGKPRPQTMMLPSWGSAAGSAVRANFLYGQAGYVLGRNTRGTDAGRLDAMVLAFNDLHHVLLDGIKDPTAEAVLAFLDHIRDDQDLRDEIAGKLSDQALAGDNFIFSVDGVRLQDVPGVADVWDAYFRNSQKGRKVQSLISGEMVVPADKHPLIKGLSGAQGSGAALSSFNMDCTASFGYEQNLNAPVSVHEAFAYTQAMGFLLRDKSSHIRFSDDLTILWWPRGGGSEYPEFMQDCTFGPADTLRVDEVRNAMAELVAGRPVGNLDPGRGFYILGVSPNASRIMVRFFLEGTFREFVGNVRAHYDRMALARFSEPMYPWNCFLAMCRKDVSKEVPEFLADSFYRSILFGTPYPKQSADWPMKRIKLETRMLSQRTALVKAYFLRALPDGDKRKECFTMSLQAECREPGYLCGRLFALYEMAQVRGRDKKAKPWDPSSLHNKFGSAMTTPAKVFPQMARLAEIYLGKSTDDGFMVNVSKEVQDVKSKLDSYPLTLDFVGQGQFDLGYYHERELMFRSRKETKNADAGDTAGKKED